MNKVMIIRYDGKPPRQLQWEGKFVPWYCDPNGFQVAIVEPAHGQLMATGNPDRYRYYRSKSVDIQVPKPNGAIKWEKLYSWKYDKVAMSVGTDDDGEILTDDNGEILTKIRFEWTLDTNDEFVIEATEEFITGKKTYNDRSKEIALMTGENTALVASNKRLDKMITDQNAVIEVMKRKIDQLEQGKNTKGRPKAVK